MAASIQIHRLRWCLTSISGRAPLCSLYRFGIPAARGRNPFPMLSCAKRTSCSEAAPKPTSCGKPSFIGCGASFANWVICFPKSKKHSPRVKELAGWSCTTTMHLVEINARPIKGETNARDYDFSRAAVQSRWQAGYADTSRMLGRRPWDAPLDPATEITVYESDAPA
jgi:hypothetical protein